MLVTASDARSGASSSGVHWTKVPIIGMPGTECGREMIVGAPVTRENESFKAEFGECDESGRWLVGMLFLCDRHAAIVAEEFGDSLDAIRKAIAEHYGWEAA